MATILVVEDVELERMNVCEILRRKGYTVLEAKNGNEGFDMAVAHKPNAILMDIVMPELDGFAATKKIKLNPETSAIPVIILSSKARESDKFRARQVGAKGYVVKPVTAEKIIPVLNQLL